MRSGLSALGFRIGGQPQSLDYGGGDKSGLTDIGTWITFLSLAHPPPRKKTSPCDVHEIKCVFWCWKLQQLELFILLYRSNSETKKTITDTQGGQHKRNQKQQISSLKHSKEEKTKEGRDNRCITDKTPVSLL